MTKKQRKLTSQIQFLKVFPRNWTCNSRKTLDLGPCTSLISEICSDVLEEAAIYGDNAYYRFPLPEEESRSLYRARTRSGLLVQKAILF